MNGCYNTLLYIVLFTIKKNDIMSFAGKWMELEIIMLSEIIQAQKSEMLHVFAHMWYLDLKW
jgi:hypothetical protein